MVKAIFSAFEPSLRSKKKHRKHPEFFSLEEESDLALLFSEASFVCCEFFVFWILIMSLKYLKRF